MKQGFSLVEMLVVVLIIGVLAAVAWPRYSASVERARTAELLSNGRLLIDSMNRALMLNPNELPNTKIALDVQLGGGSWTADNNAYQTKDFNYDISAGNYVAVTRRSGETLLYQVRLYNRYNPPDDGRAECLWANSLGEYVCKLLQRHGYTVSPYSAG